MVLSDDTELGGCIRWSSWSMPTPSPYWRPCGGRPVPISPCGSPPAHVSWWSKEFTCKYSDNRNQTLGSIRPSSVMWENPSPHGPFPHQIDKFTVRLRDHGANVGATPPFFFPSPTFTAFIVFPACSALCD